MSSFEEHLERMQADGRITPHDADEARNFASFLTATRGIPKRAASRTSEQQRDFIKAYREHYPDEYARAVAEQRAARAAPTDPGQAAPAPDSVNAVPA